MSKNLFTFIKISISVLLIFFLIVKVNIGDLFNSWKHFSASTLTLVIFFYLCAILVNVFKWKLFLPEQTFKRLLQFTFIDIFYGMALPGQISGEVAKAYRLGKRTGGMKKVSVSIWLDKLTGMIGLILLMFIGMILSSRHFPLSLYIIVAALFIAGIMSIYIFNFPLLIKFIEKYLNFKFIQNILLSLREFKKDHLVIFSNIILGMLYQVFSILITMSLAKELSINISTIDWFWIFGFISIVQFLPISIAGLGVREISFVSILALFSVSTVSALTLSLSIFGIQLLFAFIGFFVESHYNLSQS